MKIVELEWHEPQRLYSGYAQSTRGRRYYWGANAAGKLRWVDREIPGSEYAGRSVWLVRVGVPAAPSRGPQRSALPTGRRHAMTFPELNDEDAYALEITGSSMEPAYRDGTIVLVSPTSPVRRGDRVVVKTRNGEVMAKELKRRTSKTIELRSLNPRSQGTHALRSRTCSGLRASCGRASRSGIMNSQPHWRECLAHYLDAREQHREADRAYTRTYRLFDRLSKHVGDQRAAERAGLDFADRRSMAASGRQSEARADLVGSLLPKSALTRLRVMGMLWCEHIPAAQNENGRRAVPWIELRGKIEAGSGVGTWIGKYACGPARYYPAANSCDEWEL